MPTILQAEESLLGKQRTQHAVFSSVFFAVALASCGGGGGGLAAPSSLAYATNPAVYPLGVEVTNDASSMGGAVDSYAISPALPAGLTFDVATGTISGTPTTMTAQQTYTVTATNAGGSDTVDLVLTVADALPVINYPVANFALTGGVAMTPVTPSLTRSSTTRCVSARSIDRSSRTWVVTAGNTPRQPMLTVCLPSQF